MSLPIKKIYVDTKYKSAGSASNSNFKIDLPISLSFPEYWFLHRRRLHTALLVCHRRKHE